MQHLTAHCWRSDRMNGAFHRVGVGDGPIGLSAGEVGPRSTARPLTRRAFGSYPHPVFADHARIKPVALPVEAVSRCARRSSPALILCARGTKGLLPLPIGWPLRRWRALCGRFSDGCIQRVAGIERNRLRRSGPRSCGWVRTRIHAGFTFELLVLCYNEGDSHFFCVCFRSF